MAVLWPWLMQHERNDQPALSSRVASDALTDATNQQTVRSSCMGGICSLQSPAQCPHDFPRLYFEGDTLHNKQPGAEIRQTADQFVVTNANPCRTPREI